TYSWGANLPHSIPAGVEFVPMVWGLRNGEKQDSFYKHLATEAQAKKFNTLLGFNEPDGKDQANLPVADALAAWPKLMSVGVRLGSPAGVHPDVPWMTDFMRAAKKDKLRVDFITVHWYGGAGDGGAFLSYLSKIHSLYNKPIWITEFCPADWNAGPNKRNKNTPQQVAQFMKAVVPALKRTPWIERFAWFPADPASPRLGTSALFNADGSLTDLGKIYSEL
ncbi:MAG: glycoside hydrolase family protein, partial [Chthoniobacterales bacterium]